MDMIEQNRNGMMKISVRNLVEFILRSGDIDNRIAGGKRDINAMLQGGKLHRKIQGRMKGNYEAEVPLKIDVPYERFTVIVEGRADGIQTDYDKNGEPVKVTIDEIKCMYRDVQKMEQADKLHEAQAMCYGYMYLVRHPMEQIDIQITYVNMDTEEVNRIKETYAYEELEEWFMGMMKYYEKWVTFLFEHGEARVKTAREIRFPFDYRPGQKNIAVSVYKAIMQKKELFIQAPTGVGKTMSVIFPAVKAVGENLTDKIFYLTAKSITGQVAHDSFRKLRENGLDFLWISITAKDKMCILENRDCNPDVCSRAKGHFDRINEAMYDMITHEHEMNREMILSYAEKHQVCPYEFSLDLSNFCDAVICDYNYVFDPVVSLKRYFSSGSSERYVFLVDESHNLVERAREMYSADISKEDVLLVRRIIGTRQKKLTNALDRTNKILLHYKRQCDQQYVYLEDVTELILSLERLYGCLERFLDEFREFDGREEVLLFYFGVSHFLNIYENTSLTDEEDRGYYEICGHMRADDSFRVRLMCMNPSANLRRCMEKAVCTIFFSATLLPVNYYKRLLSGNVEDYAIYIDSPFGKENRKILVAKDVSSRYNKRNRQEYEKIAYYIECVAAEKEGNYMVFAPSYQFMENVIECMNGTYEILVQRQSMTEQDREDFLKKFEEKRNGTLISFCVMGGIFSEGIDLTEDRLIGTIIIGTGLPQVCMEREVLKTYFDQAGMNGFDYAYRYPGMNKVLQAAGRVIRTERDKGMIVLLDDRFWHREYELLFPREWSDMETTDIRSVKEKTGAFWRRVSEQEGRKMT